MSKRKAGQISDEMRRVMDILARDGADRERDELVRREQANERPANRHWYAITANTRGQPDAKRRYIAAPGPDHPLTRARQKGKISSLQFNDAAEYRSLCLAAFETAWGRDSTQAMMVDGGRANYEASIGVRGDREAIRTIGRLNRSLGKESAAMLLFVCYLEIEVGEAVRRATPKVHPNGVWGRFEEAVDALHYALHPQDVGRVIHPYQKSA